MGLHFARRGWEWVHICGFRVEMRMKWSWCGWVWIMKPMQNSSNTDHMMWMTWHIISLWLWKQSLTILVFPDIPGQWQLCNVYVSVMTYFVDSIGVLCGNLLDVHSTHWTANDDRSAARAVHQERQVCLTLNVQCLRYHHLQCGQHTFRMCASDTISS